PERFEVLDGQRIDAGDVFAGADLHQAKLGVKGLLANELGVQCKDALIRGAFEETMQRAGSVDEFECRHDPPSGLEEQLRYDAGQLRAAATLNAGTCAKFP